MNNILGFKPVTANQAMISSLHRLREIQAEELHRITGLPEDSKEGAVLRDIFQLITTAVSKGHFSTEFYVEAMATSNQINVKTIYKCTESLRLLGYKTEPSCSSNPSNERVFISWSSNEEES